MVAHKISSKYTVDDSAGNFLYILSSSRRLNSEYQRIVFAGLNKSAFFAYSDNLLIAMLADKHQEVWQRSHDLISFSSGPEKKQKFVFPQVNSNAQDHTELINLENELAASPMLKGTANLADIEQVPLWFDDIPCH